MHKVDYKIKYGFDNCNKQTQQIEFENIYLFEKGMVKL